MVFRSCLCSRKYQNLFLLSFKLRTTLKCPGFIQPRLIRNASNEAISNQQGKIKLTSSPTRKLTTTQELDLILNNKYSPKETKAFYYRLAKLPPKTLAHLFDNSLTQSKYDKQVQKICLEASDFWSVQTIQAVIEQWQWKHVQLRLILFSKNLLQKYILNRDITTIIDTLPTKDKPTDLLPFYNATLNQCLHCKQYDHLRLVMTVMKERNIQLDIASFNILVRMALMDNNKIAGLDVYHKLLEEGVTPNHATFNTFIKHAVQHKQWQTLNQWLDLMDANGIQPTQVTARILFRGLSKFPLEKQLAQSYNRASKALACVQKEPLINTSAAVLLKSKKPEDAIDVLKQALASNETFSVHTYNLLLKALCDLGESDHSQDLLNQIPKSDIISFTTVIHGLIHSKKTAKEIADIYRQLLNHGLRSNNVLQSVILYGLAKSDNLEETKSLFDTILKTKNQPQIPQQPNDQPLDEMQTYNIMIDFYFKHKSNNNAIPQEPFTLLNEAVVKKKLEPTTVTLNIMVRGLAILNKDLNAAEKVVELLTSKGVAMDERTIWYLSKAAYRQGQWSRAREWIKYYESMGQPVQGSGLITLKSELTKWEEKQDDLVPTKT